MSAFRTTVFLGIVYGVKREISFASDGVQIFFEHDHRGAAEVGKRGDENRLARRADCGESGTGDQLLDLEAGNGIQGICAALGFLPNARIVVALRFVAFSGEYTEKHPKLLARCKKVYVLRFMLTVSVAISTEKNVFFGNAFG